MRKITPLFILLLMMAGCSVESYDSSEDLITADAKLKIQEATIANGIYAGPNLKGTVLVTNDCDNLYIEIVPTGNDPTDAKLGVFADGGLPATNGQSGNISTNGFYSLESAPDLKWTFQLEDETSFNIFITAWGGDWAGASSTDGINQNYINYTVDYSGCDGCEESFNYDDAGDDDPTTYTFYYTPAVDMIGADLVFTFAQSVAVSGFPEIEAWVNNGNGATSSTNETTMNLEACHTYWWTLTLQKDCSGNSRNSNVWTDFKVDDVSKKNISSPTPNITQSCD